MERFVTKYDVESTMYQKFEQSAKARKDKPCFYYYNNTISWNQASEMVEYCAAALKAMV